MTAFSEKTLETEIVHVFVDNSNVYLGAQNHGGSQHKGVRLNVGKLVDIVEGKRVCATREVVGTIRQKRVRDEWEKHGYHINDPPILTKTEVFADGQLRELFMAVAKNKPEPGHRLVLVSGDGNKKEFKGNFPDCVDFALRNGWSVSVWSWKRSLNARYFDLHREFGSRIEIVKLDRFRKFVTFEAKPKAAASDS